MQKKYKFDFKLLRYLDYGYLITLLLLISFGAINILSASQTSVASTGLDYSLFKTQLAWICAGIIIIIVMLSFDYTLLQGYASILYWFGIILLILSITILKVKVNGGTSWMKIGPISVEPSEFAKLGLILILAKKLQDMDGNINKPKNFFILLFYCLIPISIMMFGQSDTGMAMVTSAIVAGIFFISGIKKRVIFSAFFIVILGAFIAFNTGVLKDYQKARLTGFMNQSSNTNSTNYQLNQGKMAIGSGELTGKGFLKGSRFVTYRTTDFIFSVVGEEWGLVGAGVLLTLYGILIFKMINIARKSKDLFGTVICIGIVSSFMFSILENIGMNIGIMPITGITLPFVSYGGSSAISYFIAMGLVLNIGMRNKKMLF